MHVLVPVFFNAPLGGLHENVLSSVRFLASRHNKVTLVCKLGSFSEQAVQAGAAVMGGDFSALSATLAQIRNLHADHPIDLIHAHPFASRQLGLMASRELKKPLIVTFHGQYLDNLPRYISETEMVFAVSEGIRQHLLEQPAVPAHKIHVIPNTIDLDLFAPRDDAPHTMDRKAIVSLVTRFDEDKAFILELLYQAVAYGASRYPGQIHWQIVGQGKLRSQVTARVEELCGSNSVAMTGWLTGEALRDAYLRSTVVIAPGRCALEAMSCSVPTIAVGSRGYIGLIDHHNWQLGVYSNFGGTGRRHDDYEPKQLEEALDRSLASSSERRLLGQFGRRLVERFFDPSQVHEKMLFCYQAAVGSGNVADR